MGGRIGGGKMGVKETENWRLTENQDGTTKLGAPNFFS
jgi:hypothetical protein